MDDDSAQGALGESAHLLRRILDASPNLIYIYDLERKSNVYSSREVTEFLGYTAEQLVAAGPALLSNLVHPEDVAAVAEHHSTCAAAADDAVLVCEYRMRGANGEWRWLRSRDVAFARNQAGRTSQILGIAEDITERKRSQEELALERAMLSAAERSAHMGSWRLDVETGLIEGSAETCRIYGQEPGSCGDTLNEVIDAAIHPDDRERVAEETSAAMRERSARRMDYRLLDPDGTVRWVHGEGHQELDAAGRVVALVGFVQDVTESKQVEHRLREASTLLEQTFEQCPVPMALIAGPDSELRIVNPACVELLGISEEPSVVGAPLSDLAPSYEIYESAGDRSADKKLPFSVALRGAETRNEEQRIVRKDGTTRCALVSGAPICDPRGEVIAGYLILVDITDRKLAEKSLEDSEEKYRLLFEDNPAPMWVFDRETLEFVAVNDTALEHYGYSRDEFLGMTIKDIRPEDDVPILMGILQDHPQSIARVPVRHRKKDGSTIHVEISTHDLEFDGRQARIVLASDVTERKQAQDELQSVLTAAPIGIGLVRGPDRLMAWANDEMTKLIGYSSEEYHGKSTRLLYATEDEWRRVGQLMAEQLTAGASGTAESRMVSKDGTPFDVELHFALVDPTDPTSDMIAILADVTDRKAAQAALKSTNEHLERLTQEITEVMGRVVEARDPYTQGHQQRVASLSRAIAEEMELSASAVESTVMSALVHDIGKLSVPAEILNRPGKLSDQEFQLIREHPRTGYQILKDIEFPWPVAVVALRHHERADGAGYPDGLIGDEILIEARIIAAADVIEAMASHRPYRSALGIDAAMDEIKATAEGFDPQVVAACIRLYEAGRIDL